MIHRVSSNREEFKAVSLRPGFNAILAERTVEASDRESRNGSGKTSFVEVVHFCLGGNPGQLRHEALSGWNFTLEMELGGRRVTVTRDTSEAGKIWLSGHAPDWPVEVREDADRGAAYISVEAWKALLGELAFGLASGAENGKFAPSARGLISYFVRRGRDGFTEPFSYFRAQPSWSKQVHTAALVGLDWSFPQRAELLRVEHDRVRKAKAAVEEWRDSAERSQPPEFVPGEATEGSLEATRIALARRARDLAEQLTTFRVHPQYHDYEREASELTGRIHDQVNKNVVARELLEHYSRSLAEERAAPDARVEDVYEEMGIHFPEQVVERVEDVRAFHRRIAENRREYLGAEIGRIENGIEARDQLIAELSDERAGILVFLKEHGALEEFLELQQQNRRTLEQLARVEAEIEELRRFEVEDARLRIEREELRLGARRDFDERRAIWSEAVELFASNTGFLYERPGQLVLDVAESGGLAFAVEIERAASQGVQEMVIFAYDLMLAQRWARTGEGLGILIHDSTIFDGVDERQIARALTLASKSAEEYGFQYLALLNSDQVPWDELPGDFDLREHVALELTDAGDTGGLFGIRFG